VIFFPDDGHVFTRASSGFFFRSRRLLFFPLSGARDKQPEMTEGSLPDAQTADQDIARQTGGSIRTGAAGPVRTGKSAFIKRFMEIRVIPGIGDEYRRTGAG